MTLADCDASVWTFKVIGSHHLDAAQKAKSKVYSENEGVEYSDLQATTITPISGNTVVVVVDMSEADESLDESQDSK